MKSFNGTPNDKANRKIKSNYVSVKELC
jgi:hypothetical protein